MPFLGKIPTPQEPKESFSSVVLLIEDKAIRGYIKPPGPLHLNEQTPRNSTPPILQPIHQHTKSSATTMKATSRILIALSLMMGAFAAPAPGADLEVRQLGGGNPFGSFLGGPPGAPSQVQNSQPAAPGNPFNTVPAKQQFPPGTSPVNNNVGPSQNTNISPNTFAPNTNSKTIGDIQSQCNSEQVVSCCNDSSQSSAGGLLGLVVGPILGGSCSGVTADLRKFPLL